MYDCWHGKPKSLLLDHEKQLLNFTIRSGRMWGANSSSPSNPKSRLIHQTFLRLDKNRGKRRISRYVVWLPFFLFFLWVTFSSLFIFRRCLTVDVGDSLRLFFLLFFALLGRSLIFLDHRYYAGHENEGRRWNERLRKRGAFF